jgi:hypothetical protein
MKLLNWLVAIIFILGMLFIISHSNAIGDGNAPNPNIGGPEENYNCPGFAVNC